MARRGRSTRGFIRAGTVLAVLAGVFAGTGLYTFDVAEGTSYLSDDPRACVNCHVMREHYDGWQKASHHAVAVCNDCHLPPEGLLAKLLVKMDNGWRHSKGFTLQDFHEPIRITPGNRDVLTANCVRCHGDLVAHIAPHAADEPAQRDCMRCHADVGKGPRD